MARIHQSKETRALIAWAVGRGWTLDPRPTGSGHRRLTRPGHRMVIIPSTPSDHRSLKNSKAQILRAEREAQEGQA